MIFNGDCIDFIKNIKNNSVDLILTDPPFLISRDSNFKNPVKSTDKMITKYNISMDFGKWDKVEIDIDFLFSEYYRVLKKGGTLIIFYDIWKCNIIKNIATKYKFKQPRICQWVKSNAVPINSKTNYLSSAVEYFFTFTKGKNPTFNSEYDNGLYKYPICHGKERIKVDGKALHPTQKPLSLINNLILKHSNEKDIVLDTFAGTFTTHVSCDNLNRNCICVEKDNNYFNFGKMRINENRARLGMDFILTVEEQIQHQPK